jgi:hypothetical protein
VAIVKWRAASRSKRCTTKSGTFSIAVAYSGDQNYQAAKSKPPQRVVEK